MPPGWRQAIQKKRAWHLPGVPERNINMEKQPHNQRQIWRLFTTFLKIGAFTFGGGYAMIPLIQREASEKNHWISDEDILDIVSHR